ncbi:MAG: DUF6352 family protein [Betaproteobacteria bacterium]
MDNPAQPRDDAAASADFWPHCGFRLLHRSPDGHLAVTDDFLRVYLSRPELALVAESCAAERQLHARLLADPCSPVAEAEVEALADPDIRDNYRVMLRFREHLITGGTLEACYAGLFDGDVPVPPQFVHHAVQVILRGLLDGEKDGLLLRAAELFFREQRVSINDGTVMLADAETVAALAEDGGLGNLGRMLRQVNAPLRSAQIDVIDRDSHEQYFRRDECHDTALQINPGTAGSLAIAELIVRWVAHFHGVRVRVVPIREIEDDEWLWHVGLDAEATALLNEIYAGGDMEESRMRRVIGLFRLDFEDAGVLRPEMAGAPVFLGMAMTAEGRLRMKPQNLLNNLPLARRT